MKAKLMIFIGSILLSSFVSIANAGLISGNLNVDNAFTAYISTDDSVAGTEVLSGTHWPTTYSFQYDLEDDVDYFLHIYGQDFGVIAGFLGDFTLTGSSHLFSNSTTSAITNAADWQVSNSGWNNYQQANAYGQNGVSPWGARGDVNSNAEWIWTNVNNRNGAIDQNAYFTIAINSTSAPAAANPVPEPTSLAIFGLSLIALSVRRFKKN